MKISICSEYNMKLLFIFIIATLALAFIGYIDLFFGYEFSFPLFYLIPVGYVAWFSGKKTGLFFALLAACLWFYIDYLSDRSYVNQYAIYWNAMMRLGIFSTVSMLIYLIHKKIKEVDVLARKDSLTTLYNRLGMIDLIQMEINRTNRYGNTFALVLIDLDNFKMINDSFGHRQGDRALKHFALLLKKNSRKTDLIGRIGGDEFVLVLPCVNQEQSVRIIEKIQKQVKQHHHKHPHLIANFSAGLLVCGETKLSAIELLSRADKLMYFSKKSHDKKITPLTL